MTIGFFLKRRLSGAFEIFGCLQDFMEFLDLVLNVFEYFVVVVFVKIISIPGQRQWLQYNHCPKFQVSSSYSLGVNVV